MWTRLLFWTCVLLLAYENVGYPLLLRAWAALRPRPPRRAPILPSVTVLVVAHDEAAAIEGRIANLLALDYPRDRLEILLASDGSADATVGMARRYERRGARVVAFGVRRGKPAVLNELVPRARGEIVVLADARQRFEATALRALVAPFADPRVGAAGGELLLTQDPEATTAEEGIGLYWRYEKWIRLNESRVDSTVGATGAIYALRRDLFEAIPEDTLLDDVLIPLTIARRGFRVVFEPGARAYDRAAKTAREEWTRKVRTLAGNFQLFARQPWLLVPWRNRLFIQTVSHKGLRLLGPALLGGALAASALLAADPLYRALLAGQAAFYAAALAAGMRRKAGRRPGFLSLPFVICLLNGATVAGFLRFLGGRQAPTWERASGGRRAAGGAGSRGGLQPEPVLAAPRGGEGEVQPQDPHHEKASEAAVAHPAHRLQ